MSSQSINIATPEINKNNTIIPTQTEEVKKQGLTPQNYLMGFLGFFAISLLFYILVKATDAKYFIKGTSIITSIILLISFIFLIIISFKKKDIQNIMFMPYMLLFLLFIVILYYERAGKLDYTDNVLVKGLAKIQASKDFYLLFNIANTFTYVLFVYDNPDAQSDVVDKDSMVPFSPKTLSQCMLVFMCGFFFNIMGMMGLD